MSFQMEEKHRGIYSGQNGQRQVGLEVYDFVLGS